MAQNQLAARRHRSIFVKKQTAILFSRIESRCDGIYANIEWRPFPGEKLREIHHRRLSRRIGYDTRHRDMGGDACYIDDAALAIFLHGRTKLLTGEQRPANQIQVKIFSPVIDRNLFERVFGCDGYPRIIAARSIYQNRWNAEPA